MHSTNYYRGFIEIAEDCPTARGEVPPIKGDKQTIASMQFGMLFENPYQYTSDDVLFAVHAKRKAFTPDEMVEQRAAYFSKGQPCFRASPLTKRYGWGVHSDAEGRIAIYGAETREYRRFVEDSSIAKVKAMRSTRK